MSTVSYDRIVNVNVDISDRFPTVANFGIPLLFTESTLVNTELENDLVRAFSSLSEIEAYGYDSTTMVYQTAKAMFGVNNAPRTIKVGYWRDGDDMTASLSELIEHDSLFYTVVVLKNMNESHANQLKSVNELLIANRKILFFSCSEDQLKDGTDPDSLAAAIRTTKPSRLAGFYRNNVVGVSDGGINNSAGLPVYEVTGTVVQINGSAGFYINADSDFPAESNLADNPNYVNYGTGYYLKVTLDSVPTDAGNVLIASDIDDASLDDPIPLTDNSQNPIAWDDITSPVYVVVYNGFGTLSTQFVESDGTVVDNSLFQQYAAKAAAFVSTVNYNQPNSHYTLKFKRLDGATPALLNDIQAQNLTGFLPGTGNNEQAGGFLNVYIRTAGLNMLVEGVMTDGSFIDLMTFTDWMVATMQANILALFTNNRVVPYDTTGVAMIYGAVAQTLDAAVASGAATETRTDIEGELLPAYEISIQDIAAVQPALQAQRIAPNVEYCIRYSGAIHYVDIRGTVKVAN